MTKVLILNDDDIELITHALTLEIERFYLVYIHTVDDPDESFAIFMYDFYCTLTAYKKITGNDYHYSIETIDKEVTKYFEGVNFYE